MELDMHTHSTASDGQYSPAELVKMAKRKNLELFSLTDHDSVMGIREARETAASLQLPFLPGIELSTQLGEEIHILGYGIDDESTGLQTFCDVLLQEREERGLRMQARLKELGISIDLEEVRELAGSAALGRPHFARVMVKKGIVRSVEEAFARYLNTPSFKAAVNRRKPQPEDAIRVIHSAGGQAVLAHPGLLKMGKNWQKTLISSLKEAGLDGIEVFYEQHPFIVRKYYLEMAVSLGLKVSAGSDFHGELVKPKLALGMTLDDRFRELLIGS